MQPSGKPEAVAPSIGFYFSDEPPTRTPAMLRLGRQNIDIPPGDSHYTITDSFMLPVDVEVEAVQPHAHYRARDVRGIATLPDGTTRALIDIADWDFRWQHVYRFVTPVRLPKGTTLSMRYIYDNSPTNPRNPQRAAAARAMGAAIVGRDGRSVDSSADARRPRSRGSEPRRSGPRSPPRTCSATRPRSKGIRPTSDCTTAWRCCISNSAATSRRSRISNARPRSRRSRAGALQPRHRADRRPPARRSGGVVP